MSALVPRVLHELMEIVEKVVSSSRTPSMHPTYCLGSFLQVIVSPGCVSHSDSRMIVTHDTAHAK